MPPQCRCSPLPTSPTGDPQLWMRVARSRRGARGRARDRSSALRREISNAPRSCFSVRCRTCISPGRYFPTREIPYQALDCAAARSRAVCGCARPRPVVREHRSDTRSARSSCFDRPHWSFQVRRARHSSPADVAAADATASRREVSSAAGIGSSALPRRPARVPVRDEHDRGRRFAVDACGAGARRSGERGARSCVRSPTAPLASAQLRPCRRSSPAHERLPSQATSGTDGIFARAPRSCRALESLAEAHRAARRRAVAASRSLPGRVRRWIEGQTFSPRTGARGVTLLDAPAAAYADVDEVHLVGLVDSDWPDRGRRSIFYPSSLLAQLGWPVDADRLSAARARFHDLLRLPRARVAVSLFTLEDDAIVPASAFLEELESAGLPVERIPRTAARAGLPPRGARPRSRSRPRRSAASRSSGWPLRASRSPALERAVPRRCRRPGSRRLRRQQGRTLPRVPVQVLRGARPQAARGARRGVGAVGAGARAVPARACSRSSSLDGRPAGNGSITTANVADALAMFEDVAEAQLADAAGIATGRVERTHLLGSAAAAGLAERAFAFEIEQRRRGRSSGCSSTSSKASSCSRRQPGRAPCDCAPRPIASTCWPTARFAWSTTSSARRRSRPGRCSCPSTASAPSSRSTGGTAAPGRSARPATSRSGRRTRSSSSAARRRSQEAVAAGQERFLAAIDGSNAGVPAGPDEPFLCTRCGYASRLPQGLRRR